MCMIKMGSDTLLISSHIDFGVIFRSIIVFKKQKREKNKTLCNRANESIVKWLKTSNQFNQPQTPNQLFFSLFFFFFLSILSEAILQSPNYQSKQEHKNKKQHQRIRCRPSVMALAPHILRSFSQQTFPKSQKKKKERKKNQKRRMIPRWHHARQFVTWSGSLQKADSKNHPKISPRRKILTTPSLSCSSLFVAESFVFTEESFD